MRFRIETKLLFFFIIITIGLVLISTFISKTYFIKNQTNEIESKLVLYQKNLYDYIGQISYQAKISANIIAELPEVTESYNEYYSTNNLDSASINLENKLVPFIERLKQEEETEPMLHFHLPPATSFYRSWTIQRGDDLRKFRNSVLNISMNHKSLFGVEVGRSGMNIRGIAPIFDKETDKYLGSVEVIYPFQSAAELIKGMKNIEVAFFLKKSAYSNVNQMFTVIEDYSIKNNITDYEIVDKSSVGFMVENLSNVGLRHAEEYNSYFFQKTHFYYYAVPIFDLSNSVIGVSVFQLDVQNSQSIYNYMINFIYLFAFISIFVAAIIYIYLINSNITNPLKQIRKNLSLLAAGNISPIINRKMKDEINDIVLSLNKLRDRRVEIIEFLDQLGNNNLKAELIVENTSDTLGTALKRLLDNFILTKEFEEKRKKEDQIQNWTNEGIAIFSDILRQNNNDIKLLCENVLQKLVEYLKINQGGIYVLQQEDDKLEPELELLAVYAFDRKKLLSKKIGLKESLVGRCAREQKSIYLKKIPSDYIKITSGLGDAPPSTLLLTPLKLENKILGVIELADFKHFEQYQINFVEKIAENMAATFSMSRINSQTAELLKKSQEQANALLLKEEEMKQNMEELHKMQAEAANKESVATGFVDAVNHSIVRADFDMYGHLLYANSKFLEKMEYSTKEAMETPVFLYVENQKDRETFKADWEKLIKGGKHLEGEVKYKTKTGYIWMLATYTAVRDRKGNIIKILFLAIDITLHKNENERIKEKILKREEQATSFVNSVNHSTIRVDFELDGKVIYANSKFLELSGFTSAELPYKSIESFMTEKNKFLFQERWKILAAGGRHIETEMEYKMKNSTVWIYGTYTLVRNRKGEPYQILFIGFNIQKK